jgi:SEC-C motif-containing protein
MSQKSREQLAMICPCQRLQDKPKLYAVCCEPFHEGKMAPTSEALMRSRFSAFSLGLTDYVNITWHNSTCPDDLALEPDSQWLKLDVLQASKKRVHFRAYYKDEDGTFKVLDETSDFVFENRWQYVNGNTHIETYKPQRNDMCLCGSGQKFKKCCGL